MNSFNFPLDFKEQTEKYEMDLIQQALKQPIQPKKTADMLGFKLPPTAWASLKYNLILIKHKQIAHGGDALLK